MNKEPSYLRFSIHSDDGHELNHVLLKDAFILSAKGLPQLKTPLLVRACELLLQQIKEARA